MFVFLGFLILGMTFEEIHAYLTRLGKRRIASRPSDFIREACKFFREKRIAGYYIHTGVVYTLNSKVPHVWIADRYGRKIDPTKFPPNAIYGKPKHSIEAELYKEPYREEMLAGLRKSGRDVDDEKPSRYRGYSPQISLLETDLNPISFGVPSSPVSGPSDPLAGIPFALRIQSTDKSVVTRIADAIRVSGAGSTVVNKLFVPTDPNGFPIYSGSVFYTSPEGHKLFRYNSDGKWYFQSADSLTNWYQSNETTESTPFTITYNNGVDPFPTLTAEQVTYYSPTNLYTDAAATSPATVEDDDIAGIKSLASDGTIFGQSNSMLQMQLKYRNGVPVIYSDGTNYLDCASRDWPTDDFFVAALINWTGTPANFARLFEIGGPNSHSTMNYFSSAHRFEFVSSVGAAAVAGGARTPDQWDIVCCTLNSPLATTRLNGAQIDSGAHTAGMTATWSARLGNYIDGGSFFFEGDIIALLVGQGVQHIPTVEAYLETLKPPV